MTQFLTGTESDVDKIRRAVREVLANEFAPKLRRAPGAAETNQRFIGKTVAAVSGGTLGEVVLYFRPAGAAKGAEVASDPEITLDAYNRFGDLEEDAWVFVEFLDGDWEIYQAFC
jgi:hypothetical protein